MYKILLALALALLAPLAAGAPIKPQETILVVQLPSAPLNTAKTYLVRDSADGSCTAGGGSIYVMCESNGTSWLARQTYGTAVGGGSAVLSNTDCPAQVGTVNQLCIESDSLAAYVCRPTLGDCDTASEWQPFSTYEKHVDNGANFTGVVRCRSPILGTGTQTDCSAEVTSLNGTVLSGGHLSLLGSYNAATPHVATGGFRVGSAHFFNGCNSEANGCGDNFSTFIKAVVPLARTYAQNSTGFNPAGIYVKMHGGYWRYRGSTFRVPHNAVMVDAAGQQFICDEKQDITTALPNATITVATDPITINFATSVCGTGTCDSGDELVQSMDVVLLSGSGDWAETGRRVKIHRIASDGLSATLESPEAADYSGAAIAATGAIWEFDTYNDGAFEPWGDSQFVGAPLIMARSNCAPANPWVPNAKGTYREVPLKALVNRYGASTLNATIYNFAHKDDQSVVGAPINTFGGGTNDTFTFVGSVRASADDANGKYSIDGWDDTTSADDGIGCKYCLGTPMADIRPNAGGGHVGTALRATGANCQNLSMDFAHEEGARTLAWLPRGCGTVEFYNIPAELHLGCAAAGSGGNDCTDVAARRPVFKIGAWDTVSGVGAIEAFYRIVGERTYLGNAFRPFIDVTGVNTRLHVEGYVEGADPILVVGDNGTVVSGLLGCEGQDGASDCALPANGSYHEFTVQDSSGAVTASGLMHRAVAGEIAGMTEKATPASGDWVVLESAGADANAKRKAQVGNLLVNTELQFLINNCVLENDGTPIPDGCVGDGTDGGGVGGSVATDPIWDAKGDLAVGTGADAAARLAVGGTAGMVPVVDSSTATGLRWIAPTGTANEVEVTTNGTTLQYGIPTNPTFGGTATATAFDSGECTVDTGLDCDPHATEGGTLGAKEGADDGTAIWRIKVPDTGLTAASGFVGPTMTADALLTGTTLVGVANTDRILGRDTAGAGAVEELTGAAVLAMIGAQATHADLTNLINNCVLENDATPIPDSCVGDGSDATGAGSLPVVDTTSIVEGSVDPTKEVRVEADGITTGTVRVWTAPDEDITVVGTAATQTLTNKTISAASNIVDADTATVATALANDPTDCGANTAATGIAANGDLTCGITPATAASTTTFTNKTYDTAATGNSFKMPEVYPFEVASCVGTTGTLQWDTDATGGPTATCTEGATETDLVYAQADFADAALARFQRRIKLPGDWSDDDITVNLKWKSNTTTTTLTAVWQVEVVCVAAAVPGGAAFDTDIASVADDGLATANQLNDATLTLTNSTVLSGCAPGNMMWLQLFRDPAHASDDLAATASLVDVELVLNRSM